MPISASETCLLSSSIVCLHRVQIFKDLRDSGQYEDSARELDAALLELTSSAEFPKVLLQSLYGVCVDSGGFKRTDAVMFCYMCRVLLLYVQKCFPWQGCWLCDIS